MKNYLSIIIVACWAEATFAASATHAISEMLVQQVAGQADSTSDDDDETESSDSTPPPSPVPSAPSPSSNAATSQSRNQNVPTKTSLNPDAQKLVSGAPLYNPNVAVHIVQKKESSDSRKTEVVLYPATAQVNGKFTQHFGTAFSAVYHLHENFGFQISGLYNWIARDSDFNTEIVEKFNQEAQAATSLLAVWGAQGGVEVTPIYGKVAWYDSTLLTYQVVLNGGAGVVSTRKQLKPKNASGPETYGDTGTKFMGSLGAGLRLEFNERYVLRLEVRDLVYTARFDSVNGCDVNDLNALENATKSGQPLTGVQVRPSCRVETFDGTDAQGQKRSANVNFAKSYASALSSDVLNNIGLYAGFGFLF